MKDFQLEPYAQKDFQKEIEFISWEKSGAKSKNNENSLNGFLMKSNQQFMI